MGLTKPKQESQPASVGPFAIFEDNRVQTISRNCDTTLVTTSSGTTEKHDEHDEMELPPDVTALHHATDDGAKANERLLNESCMTGWYQ